MYILDYKQSSKSSAETTSHSINNDVTDTSIAELATENLSNVNNEKSTTNAFNDEGIFCYFLLKEGADAVVFGTCLIC